MKLKEICEYISDRVAVTAVSKENYISTENMAQNKGGVTRSSSIPSSGVVIRYTTDDILISNIRPYFKKIWQADKTGGCSADVLCNRAKNHIDSTFLYYLLSQDAFFEYVMTGAKGCKMPRGDKGHIMDWEIDIPENKSEQTAIGQCLKMLDKKIEINKQINDNLEQQAQALYKSWFVDFEPFEDGEFVESEMGEIPVGWTVVKFSDLTEIPKKTINPQKFPETIFKHYSLPACDNGLIPENQTGKDIMSNKIILQNNTTLFSKLNPRIKRIWFTCEVQPNSICSTEFIPYRATNENESGYIFSIINSEAFYASVMGCVNGATGSHQRFHAEDTNDFLCAYNKEAVNEFSQHIDIILKKMHDLRQENVKLASMRDTLLPKLMSGELKINEIDC